MIAPFGPVEEMVVKLKPEEKGRGGERDQLDCSLSYKLLKSSTGENGYRSLSHSQMK